MKNAGSRVMGAHEVFLPWGPKGSQSAPVWVAFILDCAIIEDDKHTNKLTKAFICSKENS